MHHRSWFRFIFLSAAIWAATPASAVTFLAGYGCCYRLASASMLPTLKSGTLVAISVYWPGALPEIGDVVLFRHPRDRDTVWVKRVVAGPGDQVQMIRGLLHINGRPVQREQIADYDEGTAGASKIKRWRETLANNVSFETLDLFVNGMLDNTPVQLVPDGSFFVLGDHRDNSTDSRVAATLAGGVGYVSNDNIIGKVVRPWSGWFSALVPGNALPAPNSTVI